MASLGGIEAYMEQWLKVATKGNVRFTMAFLTNRMHLHCDVCNVGMTCAKPENAETVDFAVQEYVKLHAHVGGYNDPAKQAPSGTAHNPCSHLKVDGTTAMISHQMINGDIWKRCMRCGTQWKPVTMDFKDLPAKHPLPMATGGQSAVIDEKPQNAAIIYEKMKQYDASQMSDEQLAKKIAELQLGDKKKLQSTVGEMQSQVDDLMEKAEFDDAAKLNEALQQKKAQLQKLELAEVNAKILWAKSNLKNIPTVVEHTPTPKPAAPTTDVFEDKGRRFR